ncbi:hypothetical protein [Lentzea pudingi]|uniref:hypothetical protein n=1 Tax=Lentzea pudingi TaxID=1789439 RepID=UPI00166608BB|nr:hypothetical protein [Lentzea pudingi]
MITRLLAVAALVAAAVAVPGGAHAASAPFHDTFDNAVDADPAYGLNDNLKQRQGTGAVTYSRVSGRWNTGDVPRPWFAQVGHPNHRGALSMHLGTTAVRLDAPSTGSSISAKLTPVAGSRTSGDWSSIALGRSANSWGYVSNQDIDLGFLLRANGGVQLFQPGKPVVNLPSFAVAHDDGSFDVTLTLAGSQLDLSVNGTRRTITLGTAVPTERLWIYLGRYSDDDRTVSLVDDLRVERMNSDDLRKRPGSQLRHYGYFGARLNAAGGNHLPEVRGRSNLNWVQISDVDAYRPEVLRDCAPAGCVVHTGNEFFDCDAAGCPLYPNAAARWQVLAEKVRPYLDRVAGFALQDEPFHHGALRGRRVLRPADREHVPGQEGHADRGGHPGRRLLPRARRRRLGRLRRVLRGLRGTGRAHDEAGGACAGQGTVPAVRGRAAVVVRGQDRRGPRGYPVPALGVGAGAPRVRRHHGLRAVDGRRTCRDGPRHAGPVEVPAHHRGPGARGRPRAGGR